MATGDAADMLARLRGLLPPWFPEAGQAPVVDGVLTAIAGSLGFIYGLIAFARAQMRLATAEGGWLNLWAYDYLGGRYIRGSAESDASWRARVVKEILRERDTRSGVIQALIDLTGLTPAVFEPSLPFDTGGYDMPGRLAYDVNGAYGSLLTPWQAFVGAFRPSSSGIPNVSGYDSAPGGYDAPSQLCWNDLSDVIGPVTDADIQTAVDAVRPAVTVLTTGISDQTTLVALTDESGNPLTDEAGNPIYQD